MVTVGLVGFAGVVVFGLLYIVFFFKGASLKLPVIGMAVFALVVAAAALCTKLGITLPAIPEFPAIGGEPSQTAQAGDPNEGESKSPETGGFPQQVLLDKRGLVITATGLDENGAQGPALNVSIVNRSETDVTIQTCDASVNGYMMDTSFSAAVAAGQETAGSILFLASRMQRSGIDTVADLEFSFHILDQNRITFLDSDAITIRTSAADTYQYRFDDSGEELYNDNGVRIISKGFAEKESAFGPELVLFIENNADRAITVQAKDVLVNGSAVDTISSEDVLPGKRSAAAVTIIGTSLEYNNIEKIRDLTFYLRVIDRDRRTPLFDTAPFTFRAD